jgi:hypothetical protein
MGSRFIFLSLIFLSADLPLALLAACEQSRLLQCNTARQRRTRLEKDRIIAGQNHAERCQIR